MAKNSFLGTAPAVAQVTTVTPATIEATDIFTITLTDDAGHSSAISYTATGTTVKEVVEGLVALAVAAKAALTAPWTLLTATEDDTKVILTAVTAGVPFYAAPTTTDGGGNNTQTLVAATTVANSGPSDLKAAANWSLGTVPVNTNEVYFQDSAIDALYGLDFSAVSLASLNIAQSFTGKLGQALVPGGGYFRIGATAVDVGYHYGSGTPAGSGRIKVDLGAVQSAVTVHNSSGSPTESNRPAVRLLCNHASTVLHVRKGKVGLACETPAETSTLASASVAFVDSQASDADVLLGAGVTITTLTQTGGKAVLQSAATTVTSRGGNLTTAGSGAITTLNAQGGNIVANATGTITTVYADAGRIDFTRSRSARTVTTLAARDGSTAVIMYDPAVLTVINKLAPAGPVSISLAAA